MGRLSAPFVLAAVANGQVHQSFHSQMGFIIKTLTDAKQEIMDMKHDEEIQHSEYAQYCADTREDTENTIARLEKEIEDNHAKKETEAAKQLAKETEAAELG